MCSRGNAGISRMCMYCILYLIVGTPQILDKALMASSC